MVNLTGFLALLGAGMSDATRFLAASPLVNGGGKLASKPPGSLEAPPGQYEYYNQLNTGKPSYLKGNATSDPR